MKGTSTVSFKVKENEVAEGCHGSPSIGSGKSVVQWKTWKKYTRQDWGGYLGSRNTKYILGNMFDRWWFSRRSTNWIPTIGNLVQRENPLSNEVTVTAKRWKIVKRLPVLKGRVRKVNLLRRANPSMMNQVSKMTKDPMQRRARRKQNKEKSGPKEKKKSDDTNKHNNEMDEKLEKEGNAIMKHCSSVTRESLITTDALMDCTFLATLSVAIHSSSFIGVGSMAGYMQKAHQNHMHIQALIELAVPEDHLIGQDHQTLELQMPHKILVRDHLIARDALYWKSGPEAGRMSAQRFP